MDQTALAVTALLAAVALAGCADLPGRGLTDEEAAQAYIEAFENLNSFEHFDAVGIESTATADGDEVFRQSIEVEPDRPAFLIELFLGDQLSQGQQSPLGNTFSFGAVVEDGIEQKVHPTFDGNLSLRRDHVPDLDEDGFGSFDDLKVGESDGQTIGPDLGPGMATVGLADQGENITVESVEKITHKDRTAWRVEFTYDNETLSADGEAIVYDDPRLPAKIQVTMTFETSDTSQHPLFEVDEATLTVEFTYDDEVDVTLPDADRAPVNVRDSEPEDTGAEITGSIRADHDEEVPLGEVEMQIAAPGDEAGGGFSQTTPPPEEVHHTLLLSEGSNVTDDFELHYTDEDGDGYLSANDTYRAVVNAEEHQGNVSIYWYDTWAGKYAFQPGFELVAGLVGLVAAAVVVRRD